MQGLLNTKSNEYLAMGSSQSEQIISTLLFLHNSKFIFATSIALKCRSSNNISHNGLSFAIVIPTHPEPVPASRKTHLFFSLNNMSPCLSTSSIINYVSGLGINTF